MLVVGDLTDARRTFSLLAVAFRKREELSGRALDPSYQIPKKGVIFLLGSITLILPTVLMKPSSYLKVTINISIIITTACELTVKNPVNKERLIVSLLALLVFNNNR